MRILFTGGSSFTGAWFVRALSVAGHEVVATMTRPTPPTSPTNPTPPTGGAYADEPVRARRVELVEESAASVEHGVRFGDERFLALLRDGGFGAICHHGADVRDYKSPDFDVIEAVRGNTLGARGVARLAAESSAKIVVTGSVFEGGEGAGSDGLVHFSPYGLSKALSWRVFEHYTRTEGARAHKFVITNPFGPFEEPRFTDYLVRTWFGGSAASVRTPRYVRDNIHVDLLARAYAAFVAAPAAETPEKVTPSGYVESQGAFAQRFAQEMQARLGVECDLDLADQRDFDEPAVRVGLDAPDAHALGFDESAAWDQIASYYAELHGG